MKIRNGERLRVKVKGSESSTTNLEQVAVNGGSLMVEAGGLRIPIWGKILADGRVEVPRRNRVGENVVVRLSRPRRRERRRLGLI